MTASALPYWLEVVRALGAGIGPVLLFLTAAIAAFVAWMTYRQRKAADDLTLRQRKEADDRAEWWRRAQWAIDYAADRDDERTRIGIRALDHLLVSDLATDEDVVLIRGILDAVIEGTRDRAYNGTTSQEAPAAPRARRLPRIRRGE
ncbi:hypothetical protein MRU69_02740 [Kocuria flava]|uniref:hypothetical protein n=1 Tax=Kocuria flava TaxID=446860 RepID=UPI001FF697EC|nr:hypothetical protein [Kocuria flava]MCJ8503783.1 hypothetical protein [Kocuria flava]